MEWSQNKKQAAAPPSAYQCTKFQLSSSISFGDTEGSQNKNWGLLISETPPSGKYLYSAVVVVNAYKCDKFHLPCSISFGDMEGFQNKYWELIISPCAPQHNLLHGTTVPANTYQCAKFQLLSSISFRDMEGVPKSKSGAADLQDARQRKKIFIQRLSTRQNLMWGYQPSGIPHLLKRLCVAQILSQIKEPAIFQHCISMHHAVMRICICRRLTAICTQKWFWGGFEGEHIKILCSNPQKALPVNTRLLVHRVSKSVQQPKLQVGRNILRTKK